MRRWAAAVAAVAAAALVLSGCGQGGRAWLRPGAALLYANQRVSAAQLSAQVANLNGAYQLLRARVQPQYRPAQMPGLVLSWYLRFATADQARAEAHVSVSPYAAGRALGCLKLQVKQNGEDLTEVAVSIGLPPDMISELGRWIAIQDKLAGTPVCSRRPISPAALQVLKHRECAAAKRLDIVVNPQYGAFDYRTMQVVQVPSALAAAPGGPLVGRAPGSPKPQLVPRC